MKRDMQRAAVLLLAAFLCVSCSSRASLPPDEPGEGVGRAVPAGGASAAERPGYAVTEYDGPAFEAVGEGNGEEIDLTGLNTPSLYVAVGRMNSSPRDYEGKTIRMAGVFGSDDTKFGRRFYCSVPDTAGCCFESVEIRTETERRWPDDYPAEGEVVTVSGVFGCERVNEDYFFSFIGSARIAWGP